MFVSNVLSLLGLALAASGAVITTVPPALRGKWYKPPTPITTRQIGADDIFSESRRAVTTSAADIITALPTPAGYELAFGPLNGANNAPGFMGFTALSSYDVNACAQECNMRGADGQGGACQFFNIWSGVASGKPTTFTCSMYFIVADASSATNYGQGDLKVSLSRGYKRTNLVIDGGFEGFEDCDEFCFASSYANWVGTSPAGGDDDASVFFFEDFAHAGHGVALLGSALGVDALAGTLTPAEPLKTIAGAQYSIGFFHASSFAPPSQEAAAFVDVQWNGETVATIRPGFANWAFVRFAVTAKGNDILSFQGGAAPAWSFLDDISVFQL